MAISKTSASKKLDSRSDRVWLIVKRTRWFSRIRILRLQQRALPAPKPAAAPVAVVTPGLNVMKTISVCRKLAILLWSSQFLDTAVCLASECRRQWEMSSMQPSAMPQLPPRKIRWQWDTILLSKLLSRVHYTLMRTPFVHRFFYSQK